MFCDAATGYEQLQVKPADAGTDQRNEATGVTAMDTAADNGQNADSTDRIEEVTDTWEASPLTTPERAADPAAKGPAEHGDTDNG